MVVVVLTTSKCCTRVVVRLFLTRYRHSIDRYDVVHRVGNDHDDVYETDEGRRRRFEQFPRRKQCHRRDSHEELVLKQRVTLGTSIWWFSVKPV